MRGPNLLEICILTERINEFTRVVISLYRDINKKKEELSRQTERERERERESVCVCVCVRVRERDRL